MPRYHPDIHSVTTHPLTCDWHLDQYPFECTCGAKERLAIPDEEPMTGFLAALSPEQLDAALSYRGPDA